MMAVVVVSGLSQDCFDALREEAHGLATLKVGLASLEVTKKLRRSRRSDKMQVSPLTVESFTGRPLCSVHCMHITLLPSPHWMSVHSQPKPSTSSDSW